jgi:hypothetical protein
VADGKIAVKRGTFGAPQPACNPGNAKGLPQMLNTNRCAATAAASCSPAVSFTADLSCNDQPHCCVQQMRCVREPHLGTCWKRSEVHNTLGRLAYRCCCALELDVTLYSCTRRRQCSRCNATAASAAPVKFVGRTPLWGQRNTLQKEPHTADGAFGEDKKLQAEFRQLVRSEMETAKALLKGKAIKEHMEDSYCEMVAVRGAAHHAEADYRFVSEGSWCVHRQEAGGFHGRHMP